VRTGEDSRVSSKSVVLLAAACALAFLEGQQVPTLYLQGGDSSEPCKAAGEALRGALPDCRVVIMPGQRHAAMDTATDLFTAEVLGFLQAPGRAV
jgi:pimeloyl-ACP methyl ester carboxylesterase